MSNDLELELYVDDEMVASVSGPRDQAMVEMCRYWAQYASDGTCTVYEVKRTKINIEDVLGLPEGARVIATCDLSTTSQETPAECKHKHPDRQPSDTYCRDCGEPF